MAAIVCAAWFVQRWRKKVVLVNRGGVHVHTWALFHLLQLFGLHEVLQLQQHASAVFFQKASPKIEQSKYNICMDVTYLTGKRVTQK